MWGSAARIGGAPNKKSSRGLLLHGLAFAEMAATSASSVPLFFFVIVFVPVLLLLLRLPAIAIASNLASDASALLAFKSSLASPPLLPSWSSSSISSVCSWEGVSCSTASPRVSSLRLPGKSLLGSIPPRTLGLLDSLDTLSLRSNKLSGSLPLDLANCLSLRRLYLQKNNFSGALPYNFSLWPLLQQLDFSVNSFGGSIPSSIGNLSHLKSLYLQNNSFSGSIPPLNITSLINFSVAYNQLNGSVPSTLSRFSSNSFAGNLNLCGGPLVQCAGSPSSQPSVSPEGKHRKLTPGAIVGIVFGCIALLLLVSLLCFCLFGRPKAESQDVLDTGASEPQRGVSREAAIAADVPKRESSAVREGGEDRKRLVFIDSSKGSFDLEDLLRASAEVLGKGILGTAYKAVLEDGGMVAVKRLRDVENDNEDYRKRIEMIGSLKHQNLVPLVAYYFDKDEKLLVYEYMPSGSLSAVLHGSTAAGRTPLDWYARLRIALSTARGLAYLHSRQFVHGSVKSSNVLLTRDLDARVADYGLVQMVSLAPGSGRVAGYTAPEVTDPRKVTQQGDVFSFGVLLLELLTGKPPAQAGMEDDDGVDLPTWVQSVVGEETTAEVFDVELSKNPHAEEEMLQLLQVAMPCVAPSPDQRPTMAKVVKMIENLSKTEEEEISSDSYNGMNILPGSSSEILEH